MADTRIYDQVYSILTTIRTRLRSERDADENEGEEVVFFSIAHPVSGPVVVQEDNEYDSNAKCLVLWTYDNAELRCAARKVTEDLTPYC
jgi:hypothetical protein